MLGNSVPAPPGGAEPRLRRLRLSSLDSIEIDDALFELIAGEPRLMPHFHLSLQGGDDMILKRMKRRHSRRGRPSHGRADQKCASSRPEARRSAPISSPDFQPKLKEMALNTLKLLDDCEIIAAHIFPFSPRPNTPAARMPQLAREVVKSRASRLRTAAAERRRALARRGIVRFDSAGTRRRRQARATRQRFCALHDRGCRRASAGGKSGDRAHHRALSAPTNSTAVWA